MVANCWNRSGNTSSSNNCIAFLDETFEILKGKKIKLFRADNGFCSQNILKYLEEKNISYVVSGKLYSNIQLVIHYQKEWTPIGVGIWIGETYFSAGGWDKARRVIIIRQDELIQRKETTGKQLKLVFKYNEDEKAYRSRYHLMVTNQTLSAIEIWKQYKGRADAENRIKELKEDFGVDSFCMRNFVATEVAMRMATIAYNLISLFRHLTPQTQPTPKLRTLRFNCFAVGSWIVKEGKNMILKLSVPLERRAWYDELFSKIDDSSPPFSFCK